MNVCARKNERSRIQAAKQTIPSVELPMGHQDVCYQTHEGNVYPPALLNANRSETYANKKEFYPHGKRTLVCGGGNTRNDTGEMFA